MNGSVVTTWLVITALLGLLAFAAIWARGFSRARGLSVGGFLLASPVAAAALGFSLGFPVPLVHGLTLSAGKHLILGAKMIVDEGIYVLIDIGSGAPRYYRLPWDEKVASALQGALDERGEGGQAGVDVKPFEWSWDQNPPQFWAEPQPKVMPDKPRQEAAPEFEGEAI